MVIGPFATELVKSKSDGLSLSSGDRSRVESVRIVYTGPSGALIAAGYISSPSANFTSTIRFYNPLNVVQPNLYANDLTVKGATPPHGAEKYLSVLYHDSTSVPG